LDVEETCKAVWVGRKDQFFLFSLFFFTNFYIETFRERKLGACTIFQKKSFALSCTFVSLYLVRFFFWSFPRALLHKRNKKLSQFKEKK